MIYTTIRHLEKTLSLDLKYAFAKKLKVVFDYFPYIFADVQTDF